MRKHTVIIENLCSAAQPSKEDLVCPHGWVSEVPGKCVKVSKGAVGHGDHEDCRVDPHVVS